MKGGERWQNGNFHVELEAYAPKILTEVIFNFKRLKSASASFWVYCEKIELVDIVDAKPYFLIN